MKRTTFLLICLLGSLLVQAQRSNRITTANPYAFEAFQIGHAFLIGGDSIVAVFNYNFASQEMHFIVSLMVKTPHFQCGYFQFL